MLVAAPPRHRNNTLPPRPLSIALLLFSTFTLLLRSSLLFSSLLAAPVEFKELNHQSAQRRCLQPSGVADILPPRHNNCRGKAGNSPQTLSRTPNTEFMKWHTTCVYLCEIHTKLTQSSVSGLDVSRQSQRLWINGTVLFQFRHFSIVKCGIYTTIMEQQEGRRRHTNRKWLDKQQLKHTDGAAWHTSQHRHTQGDRARSNTAVRR